MRVATAPTCRWENISLAAVESIDQQQRLGGDFCLVPSSCGPWQSVQGGQCPLEGKRLLVLKELLAEVTKLLVCMVLFIKATFSLSCASPKGILCSSFSLTGAKPSSGNKIFPFPPTVLPCSKNVVALLLSLSSSEKPVETTHFFTCRSLLC